MIDVDKQIDAVSRQVGSRDLEEGQGRTVIISQIMDAELEDVWEACTTEEHIPKWFLPITGELELGGRFQLEGNASGTIQRCDPPEEFDATWEFAENMSWIEVRLSAVDDGQTRIQLKHIAVEDEHWAEYGPGATGVGWDGAMMGLVLYLRTGRAVDREEAYAWMASEEGKRFYTLSSERWGEAHVAAGEDEASAKAAAERTIRFYTGN